MPRLARKFSGRGAVVVAAVIALLGVGSYAIAGEGTSNFKATPMGGYEENPDISTVASGEFDARLSDDGSTLEYELSYSGLEGTVLQAHIHFGKPGVNGGISLWLCQTATNPSPTAGIPTCSQSGTVSGAIDASDVIGPVGQGIAAGELAEIIAAMRSGNAYANVHTSKFPGGEIRAQINNNRESSD